MIELKGIKSRKLALVFINPVGMKALFTTGMKWKANTVISKGIPPDAEVEYIFANAERAGVMIMLSSSEFEPVMEGVMPPILPIEISFSK